MFLSTSWRRGRQRVSFPCVDPHIYADHVNVYLWPSVAYATSVAEVGTVYTTTIRMITRVDADGGLKFKVSLLKTVVVAR